MGRASGIEDAIFNLKVTISHLKMERKKASDLIMVRMPLIAGINLT